jgi:hypothetical protein
MLGLRVERLQRKRRAKYIYKSLCRGGDVFDRANTAHKKESTGASPRLSQHCRSEKLANTIRALIEDGHDRDEMTSKIANAVSAPGKSQFVNEKITSLAKSSSGWEYKSAER